MNTVTTDRPDSGLLSACKLVARTVLWRNGAESTDVVETLARKYLAIAERHQDFVRQRRESDDVIEFAVRYVAGVHAIPPVGTDTQWFENTLAVIIELAVPNSGVDVEAAKLLPCIQAGIRESLADVPVPRSQLRIEEEEAVALGQLRDAGVEHGMSSSLLDLVERLYHGDPLSEEDQRFFYLAALASPLTRQARLEAGLDKP